MSKPIRVFWSPLSQRFYASRAYKEDPRGFVTITGEQFDVTDDIARLIAKHEITFTPESNEPKLVRPLTQGSGNVFADLGLPDAESLKIAHTLWYRGSRLHSELKDSLALHPEIWHAEGLQQMLDQWSEIATRLDKSESRRQFAFLQAALADAELPVDFMPDSDPAERLGHFVEVYEIAESQLRELREIVEKYRSDSHRLCRKDVKYPEGMMDDRCKTCKAADLFLEKAESR